MVTVWYAMSACLALLSYPNFFRTCVLCWAGLSLLSTAVRADEAPAGRSLDAEAIASTSAAAMLAGGQPALLDVAISRYRQIAADGGWPELPEDIRLAVGTRDPQVRALRQRLRISGDYQAEMSADPLSFDGGLLEALLNFQRRHGLRPDGNIAGQTLAMLNLSVDDRIAQLQHARASWDALPDEGNADKRVWVNIPEATVAAIANDNIELLLRAVVGHPTRPTPELSSEIGRVVVNPAWTVPQSIAGADLLPRQLENPDYLQQHGFRVFTSFSDDSSEVDPAQIDWSRVARDRFPYRLRQDPGSNNSLGRYKFDFRNEHDVYMHDTPSQVLLGLSVRSLSAGCVRVQNPDTLAQWLYADDKRMQQVVLRAAEDPQYNTRAFVLRKKVPVDFVYLSAWVSADGQLNFRSDVYRQSRSSLPTGAQ